jgi:hypothetical protein
MVVKKDLCWIPINLRGGGKDEELKINTVKKRNIYQFEEGLEQRK